MHLKLSIFGPPLCEARCKWMQDSWPTTTNIIGCYMLHPFAHPVPDYSVLLGVVACSLKPVKFLAMYKWMQ